MSKKLVFIDSSLAAAAIGQSTTAQREALRKAVGKRGIACSTFLRKEFIWRLVKEAFSTANVLRHWDGDTSECLEWLNQDFGGRSSKNILTLVAAILRDKGEMKASELSTELTRIGSAILREYDRRMGSPKHNRANCELGAIKVVVDWRRPYRVSQELEEAESKVTACRVTEIFPGSVEALPNTKTVKKLEKLIGQLDFRCNKCRTIGDAVIAFELPTRAMLVACDRDLEKLGKAISKNVVYVDSIRGLQPRN